MSLCLGQEIFPHPGTIKEGSILSLSADDRTYYPISLTFPEVIRWYYGIREMRISAPMNFSLSASGGTSSASLLVEDIESDPISGPSSWNGPFIGWFGREEDYLYEGLGYSNLSYVSSYMTSRAEFLDNAGDYTGDGESYVNAYVEITARIFNSSFYVDPIEKASIIKDGELYYPRIDIGFNLALTATSSNLDFPGGNSGEELYHRYYSGYNPNPGGWSSSSINVNIFGKSFTLNGWTNSSSYSTGSGATSSISGSLGSINITAFKWWPYDPNDGLGPIWDVDTGAKLRNKF